MLHFKKAGNGVRITGGAFSPGNPPLRVVDLNEEEVREVAAATICHRTKEENIKRGFMECGCIGCHIYRAWKKGA